jgi:hypothetical protein
MAATSGRTVTVFGGTDFSAAASFGVCAIADFPFGLRRHLAHPGKMRMQNGSIRGECVRHIVLFGNE